MSDSDRLRLLESLAIEYPRWPTETWRHYVVRLNILAGLIRREDQEVVGPAEDIERKGPPEPSRLPYKDD